jgi:pimeloyl-ACP methyl ester carboxylesterase
MQVRVHGAPTALTLVYLPGLHGDWTLVGGFRRALGPAVRFVELSYPRTLSWSLADYARGVEQALANHSITNGWLLGESFGSQVLWEMVNRAKFQAHGLILAGGFARHPTPGLAALAAKASGKATFGLVRRFLRVYGRVARVRFRRSPESLASVGEFIERRTLQDCRAARHRLSLVAANDPRPIVRRVKTPVYLLTGLWDPIVPWYPARAWLRENCAALRGHRIIWRADHNVLGTAPELAAAQVLKWITPPPAVDPMRQNAPPRSF